MKQQRRKQVRREFPQRQGMALMVCLFVMALSAVIVLGMLDASRTQVTALHHTPIMKSTLLSRGSSPSCDC